MAERKSRDSEIPKKYLMEPFDVLKLGSDEDPCFSKLWDPRNDICQSCGDIEVCGIAFSQLTRKKEIEIEGSREFLDMRDVQSREKQIRKFVRKRVDKYEEVDLIRLISRRFRLTKEKAITFIKK